MVRKQLTVDVIGPDDRDNDDVAGGLESVALLNACHQRNGYYRANQWQADCCDSRLLSHINKTAATLCKTVYPGVDADVNFCQSAPASAATT